MLNIPSIRDRIEQILADRVGPVTRAPLGPMSRRDAEVNSLKLKVRSVLPTGEDVTVPVNVVVSGLQEGEQVGSCIGDAKTADDSDLVSHVAVTVQAVASSDRDDDPFADTVGRYGDEWEAMVPPAFRLRMLDSGYQGATGRRWTDMDFSLWLVSDDPEADADKLEQTVRYLADVAGVLVAAGRSQKVVAGKARTSTVPLGVVSPPKFPSAVSTGV